MRAVLRRVGLALHRFWFAREVPLAQPLLRVVAGCYFLSGGLGLDLGRLAAAGRRPLALIDPSPVLDLSPLPFPMTPDTAAHFGAAMTLCAILFTVGLLTRPALLVFVAGYWHVGAGIAAWGYKPHAILGLVQALTVLVVAPGTTAWSLDRALAWAWARRRGRRAMLRAALTGPPVARWGTQLVVTLFATLLFAAGLAKVRHGGVRWMDGHTLGFYLGGRSTLHIPDARTPGATLRELSVWTHGFSQLSGPASVAPARAWKDGFGIESHLYDATPTGLGRRIARQPWLLVASSVATVVFELAAPLLLVGGVPRATYTLASIGFFIGIRMSMGINFLPWTWLLLCTLDWSRFYSFVRGRLRGRPRLRAADAVPAVRLAEV